MRWITKANYDGDYAKGNDLHYTRQISLKKDIRILELYVKK